MKICPIGGATGPLRAGTDNAATTATTATTAASTAPAQPAGPAAKLQSALLQPALAALRAMPEQAIDQPRVAALRDALAAGALPFDATRLAGLIQRFHGGQP